MLIKSGILLKNHVSCKLFQIWDFEKTIEKQLRGAPTIKDLKIAERLERLKQYNRRNNNDDDDNDDDDDDDDDDLLLLVLIFIIHHIICLHHPKTIAISKII